MVDNRDRMTAPKWLSVEVLGSFIVTIFIVGAAYASLSGAQTETSRRIAAVEREQAALRGTMNSIEIDVSVIRNSQEYLRKSMDNQNAATSRIWDLLEARLNGPPENGRNK